MEKHNSHYKQACPKTKSTKFDQRAKNMNNIEDDLIVML